MLFAEKREARKDVEAGRVSLLPPAPLSLVYVLLHAFRVCVSVHAFLSRSLSADGITLSSCLLTSLILTYCIVDVLPR